MAENMVVCVVPVNTPGYSPYTASIKIKATCCGAESWLGPRGQELVAAGVPTLCVFCAAKEGYQSNELLNLGNPEDTNRRN